uniref:Ovule protein n=1 Tax=Haemonchus placei TaxID=6290 RepID=A0A0N4WHA4_HAEPC
LAFAVRDIVAGHRRPLVDCPRSPFSYIFRRATFMGQSARITHKLIANDSLFTSMAGSIDLIPCLSFSLLH